MARTRNSKSSFISLNPSFFTHFLSLFPFNSLHYSPKKNSRNTQTHLASSPFLSFCFLSLLVFLTFFGILLLTFTTLFQNSVLCPETSSSPLFLASILAAASGSVQDEPITLSTGAMVPLPAHRAAGNILEEEKEFWKQPDNQGYVPCLDSVSSIEKPLQRFPKRGGNFWWLLLQED